MRKSKRNVLSAWYYPRQKIFIYARVLKRYMMYYCQDCIFCYGGCCTMIGKKKGVATQNRRLAPALSTHNCAYSLNLACGDWIRNSTIISKSRGTYEITKLVTFSPKHDSHLRKINEEGYYQNEDKYFSKFSTLRLFSATRWAARASSLTSLWKLWKARGTVGLVFRWIQR